MRRALDEFVVEGIQTTIPFHRQLMDDERFKRGDFDTRFLDDFEMQPAPVEVA
jgi:acetyl-CoA carboxylase biotin carboxylase subunit